MNSSQKRLKQSGTERWVQSLKTTNSGPRKSAISKSHTGDFNGLVQQAWDSNRTKSSNAIHGSMPNNLNQMGRPDKVDINGKTKGPTYKSAEEYYDEIIALKKQIGIIQSENETIKSKCRRLEQEAAKKEKQMEQILDPSKDSELRRTLADSKSSNSSTVVQSLKQKVFRLEVQLREKESENSKLSSDIKLTKVEEYKVQYEVLFNELQRLRDCLAQAKSSLHQAAATAPATPRSARSTGKPPLAFSRSASSLSGEQTNLQRSMKKLAEDKNRLEAENQKLRNDLNRSLEHGTYNNSAQPTQARSTSDHKRLSYDYEDMNQKELLREIEKLNLQLSENSMEDKNKQIIELQKQIMDYKITNNTQATELESLKRIVQLQKSTESKLKSDYEAKCREVKELEEAIIILKQEADREKSILPPPAVNELRPRQPRKRVTRNRTESSKPTPGDGPSPEEIENFKMNHAAKVIQRNWANHQDDTNVSLIQSAIQGHNSREVTLSATQRSH